MAHSAKPRWTTGTVAASLLFSLVLHGILFLALWFWPTRTRAPTLTIASTRIMLDTCILDSASSTLLPERELPPDLLGANVNTTLAPQLEGATTTQKPLVSVPNGINGKGNERGNAPHGGSLFAPAAKAASVVFVLDRSVSMGINRKLDFARRELIASLRRLPSTVRFQVIAYNNYAEPLIVDGRRNLLPADPVIVEKAVSLLLALEPAGATNHLAALRLGLDLHPDVLYLLTDADDLKPELISAVTQRNQHSVIHTIELTRLRAPHPEGPLAHLAQNNHGTYRRVVLGD